MKITSVVIEQMKDAMRSKNKLRLETLRMLKAALQTDASQGEYTEEEELAILNKQLKRRKDAVEMYIKGERPELAEKEEQEADIIKEFLPKFLSEEEIRTIVKTAYDAGATNMGAMMQEVMPQVKGKADGKLVQSIVKEILNG